MTLTLQQEQAMKRIKDFIADKNEQVFILKGYTGTRKTTLANYLVDYILQNLYLSR